MDIPYIEFIGGEMDGKIVAMTTLPPEVRIPHQSKLSFVGSDYYNSIPDNGPEITRYRRLGFTHLYICIDWWI